MVDDRLRLPAPRLPRILGIGVVAWFLGPGSGSAFAQAGSDVPLGRVVWTTFTGSQATINSRLFAPDPVPTELADDGRARVDPVALMLAKDGTVSIEKAVTIGSPAPQSTLELLHPVLDFTGKRLLFAGGPSWGPAAMPAGTKPNPNPTTAITGGTAIFFGKPDNAVTRPQAQPGAAMDAYPVSDSLARHVYFARFFFGPGTVEVPGWYLMRKPWSAVEGRTTEAEDFVVDSEGNRVRGYQPFIPSSGSHMVFVRPDPENVGTDVWSMPMPPESGKPAKLFEAESDQANWQRPAPGSDPDKWRDYGERGSKARTARPVVTADLRYVAYGCDRDGDWDIYTRPLTLGADGSLTAGAERRVVGGDVRDGANETWPSLSGDGRWMAFMTYEEGAASTVQYVSLAAAGDTAGSPQAIPGADEGSMWPYWDEDDDPPHLKVVFGPADGGDPMQLELLDQEPDSTISSDVVTVTVKLKDFYPEAPAPGSGQAPLFPPIDFKGRIEYRTGAQDGARGNDLLLVVAGRKKAFGAHQGFGDLYTPLATPGTAPSGNRFTDPKLTDASLDGIFVFENVRLQVKAMARDNRWLRVGPTDGLYPTGQVPPPTREVTDLLDRDPRSFQEGPARPPYLPLISHQDNMERRRPGLTWWVESVEPRTATDEAQFKVTNENVPDFICRVPNYPADKFPDSPALYLRVVARDLLSNVTDVRIPIHVRPKNFSVTAIESSSGRQQKGTP